MAFTLSERFVWHLLLSKPLPSEASKQHIVRLNNQNMFYNMFFYLQISKKSSIFAPENKIR